MHSLFKQFFRIDGSYFFTQGNKGVPFLKDLTYTICSKLMSCTQKHTIIVVLLVCSLMLLGDMVVLLG